MAPVSATRVDNRSALCSQTPPDDGVRVLLEGAADPASQSQAAMQGVSYLALAHGTGLWAKADDYYFRTVARVQRLWQAGAPACSVAMQVTVHRAVHWDTVGSELFMCAMLRYAQRLLRAWSLGDAQLVMCELCANEGTMLASKTMSVKCWLQACKEPHADIAAGEAEAAARLCEHLLHLQRRQRAHLGRLGARLARIRTLASALAAFGQSGNHYHKAGAPGGGAGVAGGLEDAALVSAFAVPLQVRAQHGWRAPCMPAYFSDHGYVLTDYA